MTWLAAAGDYQVTLRSGQVIARNPKGRELKALPPAIKDDPAVVRLRQLIEWLVRHDAQVRETVDRWMVRSLPVPIEVLAQVWADESWRTALTDLVVAVPDDDGTWDPDGVGFLRDATTDGSGSGIGIVNLDGDTVRLDAARIAIGHPVTLPDLADLREFAADLGVRQSVDQLFRETWTRAEDVDPKATSISDYSGGKFEELRHVMARATSLGYPVRGGYAVCSVFEAGRTVEARTWIGADDPHYETETGDLVFVERDGTSILLGDVGPVAWSEGLRMAATLYAGRVVESSGEEEA